MQIRPRFAFLAIAAAASAAGHAHAVVVLTNGQSINLATLLASGSDRTIEIDDKRFTFLSVTSSTFSRSAFSIRAYVSATINQWGLNDVGFDIVGPFGDFTPGNGSYADMNIRYRAEVLPSAYAADVSLRGIGLSFDGAASGTGAIARVDETVMDLDNNRFLGNLSAFAAAGPPPSGTWSNSLDFVQLTGLPGFRAFEVNKNIKFLAPADGSATATFIRQEFRQAILPAPGAIALLGIGAVLTGGRRRR